MESPHRQLSIDTGFIKIRSLRQKLWGKTGTAEAPPFFIDGESSPIVGLDHSWFLVMAAPADRTRPSVVVAVLVENGGSGGRVAGPIANQVLYALQREGYFN